MPSMDEDAVADKICVSDKLDATRGQISDHFLAV